MLPLVPGLALPHTASRCGCCAGSVEFEEARGQVAGLVEFGERWDGHPWVPPLAERLARQIAVAEAGEEPAGFGYR